MAWRGPRTPTDPRLNTHHWRKVVRPYWQARRLPCARCGKPIDYDGKPYVKTITGKRIQNPRYLYVGHIVSRYDAKRWGWTDAEADSIQNSQPEHADCSNRSGARDGQKIQKTKPRQTINTARRW